MKKIILLFISIILLSCGDKTGNRMHRGDLVRITTECIGCYSETDLDKVTDAANSRNSNVFKTSLATTDHILLTKGMRATVQQIKVGKVNVVLNNGKSVWVMSKHVEK